MGKFKDILNGINPKLKSLPLFHTCDGYAFRSILVSSTLERRPCHVFTGESLVYSFYGKPAYRVKGGLSVSNPAFFPVAFIFNANTLPTPHKIFPFDTGAFSQHTGVKAKYFHHRMKREDFQLDSHLNAAKGLVEYFFNSNENYCDCNPSKTPASIPASELEAFAYCSMINDSSATEFDDRLASIEFIFNDDLSISKETLLNVILPKAFYNDPVIKASLANLGIKSPLVYYTIRGNPGEYHSVVYNMAREYLESNSLL